ncbi:hypothetical protein BCR36DRAFT_408036 [Piromyces finnis]|uniref:Endoplasmic reticulum junction formation protein lunapark n=1 Tax=Piromyces finnis TaxID=1754191 RepID=A0A1Y1VNT5_9FUNG|nr:hypothetical protein BCR36DRAFT_408036 [Piromyces finnis]|eukprot:ORX61056.1 hypothetical protein BCR36DRAFT_408036 [Piromyces finnis]
MFWRRRSSTKEKDYEKLLEDIDSEIKRVEDNLRQIKIREDRSIITWLYYSIPAYSLILIVYSFILYKIQDPWPVLCIKASPLLIGLFLIIFIKKFISIWYKKQQMKEEERDNVLKKEQKEILEELKSKLKYYQTKNLIEKYELQEQPAFPMKNNGMQMMYPQMQMNNQRMIPNQMRNQQMPLSKAKKQQLMGGHTISKQRSMPVVLQNGKQQYTDNRYNQYQQLPSSETPSNPNERKWIDKLMDAIVGDVNEADTKYALVCNYCYTHCGLALPEEYKTFKYICPSCKKMNDNAKKYNVSNTKDKNSTGNDSKLLPPTVPINKEGTNNNIPINNTQNEQISSQTSAPIIPGNSIQPNLERRSSTLLEEMDDLTNTEINQTQIEDNSQEITMEGGNDENLEQDDNIINEFDQVIEQEKEIINYPEEDNENVINKENVNGAEDINDNEEEVKDDNDIQESLELSSENCQKVENDKQITADENSKKEN